MTFNAQLHVNQITCVRDEKIIFAQLSFQLGKAEALIVEGTNGSGKSTLLRALTGLSPPVKGEILWQGHSIFAPLSPYPEALQYVGHTNGIKLGLTVAENLKLLGYLASCQINGLDVLSELDLDGHKNTLTHALSAGQKRKVALAKLLLFPKLLWILDEPLTALDEKTQQFFLLQLKKHLKNGGSAVITTHQPDLFKSIATQTLRLSYASND